MLGRKDASLVIRNPKISSKHIEFTVEEYSEENAVRNHPFFRVHSWAQTCP